MEHVNAKTCNLIKGSDGSEYQSIRKLAKNLHVDRQRISENINDKGFFKFRDVEYRPIRKPVNCGGKNETESNDPLENNKEYQDFLRYKDAESLPFQKYTFVFSQKKSGYRYAVALFSDAHIEETVVPNSVLGLNEYNVEIAKKRIENYFVNLVNCLNEDKVKHLIFASLGDTISGYIHDELAQCNKLSPLEATFVAQSLIFSGLSYIVEHSNVETIKFIGIVGNHSRTTKKIQHANGYKLSYEWLMYKNIEQQCKTAGFDKIEFCIPESEMAIVDTPDNKRFLFMHGFQIKSSGSGTVCGIYPALNRLSMKLDNNFDQDKIYLGHFHSCVSIPNATVNGSFIGFNSFALTNGFAYEEPAQMYEVYDSEIGQLLTRKIYCK